MTTTVGVEEEFHVVDPLSRHLVPAGRVILQHVGDDHAVTAGQFSSEIHRTMVETCTVVCHGLDEVAAQLRWLRDTLKEAADQEGLAIAAAGTMPLAAGSRHTLEISDHRYVEIAHLHARIVAGMSTCGTHVHVGVADRELGVAVMNRVRRWLPVLLALSANSPFLDGADTGYASYRSVVWGRWPTSHIPEPFDDLAQHDAVVSALLDSGAILDRKQIYWDVRLNPHHPTVEFRVADVPLTVRDTVLQAGLCRALVETALAAECAGERTPRYRPELLRAAKWRAARYGMSGTLLDLDRRQPVPAASEAATLLAHVRDALAEADELERISGLVDRVVREGTGAARQRARYDQAGDVGAVVDMVLTAT